MKICYTLDGERNLWYNIYVDEGKTKRNLSERKLPMKQFAENVKTANLELNEKNELKQNVRNEFKVNVMQALKETLENAGVSVTETKEGLAVEFANDEIGSVTVIFDGTVKSQDFDILTAEREFKEKQIEKAEKALAKEKLKAEKIAEKEAMAKAKAEKAKK